MTRRPAESTTGSVDRVRRPAAPPLRTSWIGCAAIGGTGDERAGLRQQCAGVAAAALGLLERLRAAELSVGANGLQVRVIPKILRAYIFLTTVKTLSVESELGLTLA